MTVQELLHNRMFVARKWTESLLDDTDPKRWFDPPAPGVQHLAWQMGHLGVSQAALVQARCLSRPLAEVAPEGWMAQFGRGSKPTPGPTGYPPLAEIRAFFDRTNEQTLKIIREFDAKELDAPPLGDPHPMFATKAQCLAMVAQHETFHAGQIALTRRIFGLAPLR